MGLNEYKKIKKSLNPEIKVEDYLPMVKRVAIQLKNKMFPNAELDDLIQAGAIGLIEAASRYNAKKNDSFEAYALLRIRGSMIDDSRKGDWAPKGVYTKAKEISLAIKRVESRVKRTAKPEEIAQELGVSIIEYHERLNYTNSAKLIDIDYLDYGRDENPFLSSGDSNPSKEAIEGDLKKILAEQISKLPENEKIVISLYYIEELNYREIAETLNVSESRVSQIHSQATSRLRAKLDNWI